MKSCFGTLISFAILAGVVGGAVALWYLSHNTEFSRKPEIRAIR